MFVAPSDISTPSLVVIHYSWTFNINLLLYTTFLKRSMIFLSCLSYLLHNNHIIIMWFFFIFLWFIYLVNTVTSPSKMNWHFCHFSKPWWGKFKSSAINVSYASATSRWHRNMWRAATWGREIVVHVAAFGWTRAVNLQAPPCPWSSEPGTALMGLVRVEECTPA